MVRDDFSTATKSVLASRVGHRCSRPDCRALTSGPQVDDAKSLNVGVGAHITAASQGGPRFDATLTAAERCDPANGIWLCQTCAKLIDNDPARFTAVVLREWRRLAETEALRLIGKSAPETRDEEAVRDEWVTLRYIETTGIEQRLRSQGYRLRWSAADEELERHALGWQIVELPSPRGGLMRLKVRDRVREYLVLMKRPL
jgi:hypothetical protein